jgi:transposase InsO family protein
VGVNYLDDVIIGGEDRSSHDKNLQEVLAVLQHFGFRVAAHKVQYAMATVNFIGFTISQGTYTMSAYVAKLVPQLPIVSSRRQLQQLLGQLNQLRGFIPGYSGLTVSLYQLLGQSGQIDWVSVRQTCCTVVGACLGRMYRLALIDGVQEFQLFTDWSSSGIGYALFADHKLVAIGSKQLPSWRNPVSSFLGELYALTWALAQVLTTVRGAQLVCYTDSHSALKVLHNPSSWPRFVDGRILRLLGFILGNFTLAGDLHLKFVPGQANQLADWLSRWRWPPFASKDLQEWRQRMDLGVTTPRTAVLAFEPHKTVDEVITDAHAGHFCAETTQWVLQQHGYRIPFHMIKSFVARCKTCQRFRRPYTRNTLGELPIARQVNDQVAIDLLGPLKTSKHSSMYLVTMVDYFSHYGEGFPTAGTTAADVIFGIEEWTKRHGPPRRLILDQGPAMVSRQVDQYASCRMIDLWFVAPGSHKSNGLVERFHLTLADRLRKLTVASGLSPFEWPKVLGNALSLIRMVPNKGTGFPPRLLHCRQDIRGFQVPLQEWQACVKEAHQRLAKNRSLANVKRTNKWNFQRGDLVWIYDYEREANMSKKLFPRWFGPCTIHSKLSSHLYLIQKKRHRTLVMAHLDSLQPYGDMFLECAEKRVGY